MSENKLRCFDCKYCVVGKISKKPMCRNKASWRSKEDTNTSILETDGACELFEPMTDDRCGDCRNCVKDLDRRTRCVQTASEHYNTYIEHDNKACEYYEPAWFKGFKKPELLMKVKGE